MSGAAMGGVSSAGRVLVVRVGAMGDVLHALPAVAALRTQWPQAEIDWVVDPRWAPLLVDDQGAGPVVSGVHLAETKLWSRAPWSAATRRSVLGLRRALRAGRYDAVVDLQGTLRSAVIGRFAVRRHAAMTGRLVGAQRFAGFADPREPAAAWLYRERFPRGGTHVVEQGAALLGAALGTELSPFSFELPRTAWAENWAGQLLGADRVAVLAASAGWGAKQWPAERYAALARALRARGMRVVVNAPRKDDAIAASVAEASGGSAEIVVCNVAGLIALLQRAALVVGGDTGPVHLAAALGVPVVGLYGPTDPARNGPWGPGPVRVLRHPASVTSYRHVAAVDPGLMRLGVDEVFAAALEVLEAAAV